MNIKKGGFICLAALFYCITGLCQKDDFLELSDVDYKIINDIFGNSSKKNRKGIILYHRTDFDKSWSRFFYKTNLIYESAGLFTVVPDSTLKSLLTDSVLDKFAHSIQISRPLEIKKNKLNSNIKLSDSFDTAKDLSNNVMRISKPIVSDNIGVVRTVSIDEAHIYIMQKRKDNWEIIYTIDDWLILE